MNALIIARKEIHQAVRNRWVLSSTLLLAGLALSLTFLGSAPTGTVGVRALDVVIVSLSSLTIFLIPLIALVPQIIVRRERVCDEIHTRRRRWSGRRRRFHFP